MGPIGFGGCVPVGKNRGKGEVGVCFLEGEQEGEGARHSIFYTMFQIKSEVHKKK